MSTDYRRLVESYIALWNLPDDGRDVQAKEVFTEDVFYCDPVVAVRGREKLGEYIGQTRQRFAGRTFRPLEPVDGHHDQVRFRWELAGSDDSTLVGFDVALLHGNQIRAIHGFFD